MLEIGSIIDGKYKILNKIGQGGMSVVYLALNEKANKSWAVKEIRKDGAGQNTIYKQGLMAEIEILKHLNHKNLPSIIDVIDDGDTFLIVMDYVEGNPLSTLLDEQGAQPQDKVIEWGKQLCDVLGYLHKCNPPIIYRDMKPSNVMLKPDGSVVLIDFGAAREYKRERVEDTTCLGTQGYAAPEQFGGMGQTDARTDIYTLGATMYHLLTNHNPCLPPYEMYPIRQWNAGLSGGLEEIILKCTRRDPLERYQNCDELYYALEHYTEQDKKYRKTQKIKFILFCISFSFMLLGGMMAGYGKYMETKSISEKYENLVTDAVTKSSIEERLDTYKQAVSLEPEREEAYKAILETLTEDGFLDAQEDEYFRNLLAGVATDGKTFDENFRRNKKAYSDFAYEMGKTYWYNYAVYNEETNQYDNQKSYSLAARWFERVQESDDSLQAAKYANAQIYARMGKYYSQLGKVDQAGDAQINFSTYWNDLITLFDGQESNAITRLYLNKEIVGQIIQNATHYRDEGIEREQLEEMLVRVQEDISKIQVDELNKEIYTEQISKIQENLNTAIKAINAAYSVR